MFKYHENVRKYLCLEILEYILVTELVAIDGTETNQWKKLFITHL